MSEKSLKPGCEGGASKNGISLQRKRKFECDEEEMSVSQRDNENNKNNETANTQVTKESKVLVAIQPRQNAPTFSQFRGLTSFKHTPNSSLFSRDCPLPNFNWADPREVFDLMVHKDAVYPRNHIMLLRHPELHPRMRSILLDWLIEVSEVYKLHRETFYLAQDYIDRYLGVKSSIPKGQLQLIGISALFIAAKMEEIYPPKLSEFAYVTDGACTENEILEKELIILKTLNWDLTPVTVNSWLNIYLQVSNNLEKDKTSLLPDFSTYLFAQVAQLLDLCMLDVSCLQFTYSVLAASALYHKSSRTLALSVSGFQWTDISSCVKWMEPFAEVLNESGDAQLKFFNKIDKDDLHNIQIHNIDLKLLEKAQSIQLSRTPVRITCDCSAVRSGALTPPHSCKKQCIEL